MGKGVDGRRSKSSPLGGLHIKNTKLKREGFFERGVEGSEPSNPHSCVFSKEKWLNITGNGGDNIQS